MESGPICLYQWLLWLYDNGLDLGHWQSQQRTDAFYARELQSELQRRADEGDPVYDEDGSYMQLPDAYRVDYSECRVKILKYRKNEYIKNFASEHVVVLPVGIACAGRQRKLYV